MVRTVNEAAYKARRDAILDAAQRIIETKGYEQMAIADLLSDLQISSGGLFHYFDSKLAVLSALVARMGDQVEQLVLPIVQDRELGALDKLQRFFATLNHWKRAHQHFVLAYLRVWYADENAIVRHKLYTERCKRFTPWLEELIRQGIREGALTTPYPDQAARMVLSLFEDLAYAAAKLILSGEHGLSALPRLERIIAAHADALERVLGAPAGCLQHASREGLSQWLVPPTRAKEEQES